MAPITFETLKKHEYRLTPLLPKGVKVACVVASEDDGVATAVFHDSGAGGLTATYSAEISADAKVFYLDGATSGVRNAVKSWLSQVQQSKE
jgi:hypothetical protein